MSGFWSRGIGRWEWGVGVLGACLVLVLSAAPHWIEQFDDLFITLAYAHEWVEAGDLRWTSGERVEGYSNFLFLCLCAAGATLGIDTAILAKSISLASALGIVALSGARAPRNAAGILLVYTLAANAALGYWAALGLETTLFSLLLCVGWGGALGGLRWAVPVLVLSALTRPEGLAHAAAGSLVVLSQRRWTWSDTAAIVALGAYHAVRVAHFEAVLPTPILVKALGVTEYGGGLLQLIRETPTALSVVALPLALTRTRGRASAIAMLPLAIQIAVLLAANGDWMAWGRILIPGSLAAASSLVWTAGQNSAEKMSRRVTFLAPAAIAGILLQPSAPADGGLRLRDPYSPSTDPFFRHLDTPIAADLAWVVENVPDGATIMASDIGILGHVPGVKVRDSAGLVDRVVAEQRAGLLHRDAAEWRREYGAGPGQISFLRLVDWNGGETPSLDDSWSREFVGHEDVTVGRMSARWYFAAWDRPDQATIQRRWLVLSERFPSLWFPRWRLMLARARVRDPLGEVPGETAGTPLSEVPESLSFVSSDLPLDWVPGRGFGLYWNGHLESRPIPHDERNVRLVLSSSCEASTSADVEITSGEDVARSTVRLSGPVEVPIPASGSNTRVVRVFFYDDGEDNGCDKNLFAYITDQE